MTEKTEYLYRFLSACGGNWRNAAAISCESCPYQQALPCSGYLIAFDADGKVLAMSAATLSAMIDQTMDLHECIGQLPRPVFEILFARYLLWQTSSSLQCPLQQLQKDGCRKP